MALIKYSHLPLGLLVDTFTSHAKIGESFKLYIINSVPVTTG